MLTVADIFRRHVEEYLELFGDQVLPSHRRAIADIVACRTEAMGGVLRECDECGRHRTVFHSCRNRACPECHGKETIRWMAGRAEEMLPVTYHHAVFTVPWQLRPVARRHQRLVLSALMRAAAESLQTLAADPRFGGGQLAILSVLHTWSGSLQWHPHVHCLVPGLVVRHDGTWQRVSRKFLLPVQALSRIMAPKFARLVRKEMPDIELPDAIWDRPWNVFIRPCPEGAEKVLRYLARYVLQGPMHNRRILGTENGRYVLQYRDNDTRQFASVRLEPHEFLRRYLQHTLPKGMHKVRYFGWWGPSRRTILRGLQLQLRADPTELVDALAAEIDRIQAADTTRVCPHCGCTSSQIIERLPRERSGLLRSRHPP